MAAPGCYQGIDIPRSPGIRRSGVTLTEVLMSLMIMSIGISAVAVLFPISVLRSVQATQLTNAAILKENARALVEMKPELVFDPDGDGNYQEHIGAVNELKYIVDPAGYFAIATGAAFDGTSAYAVHPALNGGALPATQNDSAARGGADWFGNTDTDADGLPEGLIGLPRYDGGIRVGTVTGGRPDGFLPLGGDPEETRALRMLAATLSKLGDAWDTQVEANPEAYVFHDGTISSSASATNLITGVRFPGDVDLTAVPTSRSLVPFVGTTQIIPDPETVRAVIFSVDGSFSVSLPLTQIVGQDVFWSEDLDADAVLDAGEDLNMNGVLDVRSLPQQFLAATPTGYQYQIGRVVLQSSRTQDYNWLLTVRRGRDGQARGIDVVVTHNKGLTPADERAYAAEFNAGFASVEILSSGGLVEPGGEVARPALRKGGYMLDVVNARWYRIQSYTQVPSVTVGSGASAVSGPGYVIQIETAAVESSVGGAVFLPGVVDVYPAGSLTLPNNL